MTEEERQKAQEALNADYAKYVVEAEAAKAQGKALGTFLEWQHKYGSLDVKIPER